LGRTFGGRRLFLVFQHISDEVATPIHARDMKANERRLYEEYENRKRAKDTEGYELGDSDLDKPEVIKEPMNVVPRYAGKLKMFKTSVSLPGFIIDDLRRLARIRGMTSYQALPRELLSEKVYEEKRRLDLFG